MDKALLKSVSLGFIESEFWRGGTSNGIMLLGSQVPGWTELRAALGKENGGLNNPANVTEMLKTAEKTLEPLFGAIFGSPDPKYGRQLNGMGGGLSSLSKAMIVDVAAPNNDSATGNSAEAVDIDYTFVQIGIKDGKLDLQGNCGNMTSAVAPFAFNNKLFNISDRAIWKKDDKKRFTSAKDGSSRRPRVGSLTVKLRNMNTMKRINAEITLTGTTPAVQFHEQGDYVMDGVPGFGSPITLSFLLPAGAKTGKAMPSGVPVDEWETSPGGQKIRASLLDISNPGVFVDGRALGWSPNSTPEQLNDNAELMAILESIRQEGAKRMGLDSDTQTIPKIVMLFPPSSEDVDITCQAISMQQAHKAVPVTHALNLGVACKLEGTIAHELATSKDSVRTVIGHPSGKLEVGADISSHGEIISAKLIRTARCLMKGFVNTKPSTEWTIEEQDI